MAKLGYAVMMVLILEASLYFFAGSELASTNLFSLVLNPQTLLDNSLYAIVIIGMLTTFAASSIIPGNFWQVNTFALYAGVAAVLITFAASIVHFYSYLNGALIGHLGTSLTQMVLVILVGPLLLFYIIAVVEWVRSNT